MRIRFLLLSVLAFFAPINATFANTGDSRIEWEVYNPFRIYKKHAHFQRHYDAFLQIAKENGGKIPKDVILRIERKLNAPGCKDNSSPESCFNTKISSDEYEDRRVGWAAKSFLPSELCYGGNALVHQVECDRFINTSIDRDNLIKPKDYRVSLFLKEEVAQNFAGRTCEWTIAGKTHRIDCKSRVPDMDILSAGIDVTVALPDGTKIARNVKVQDLLIVGLGDSFASGEGNPDKPVVMHGVWATPYDWPEFQNVRRDFWPMRATKQPSNNSGRPLSLSEHQAVVRDGGTHITSEKDDLDRFYNARAQWVSPDCHRSQYSYQFRVALQLAMEDRKRAVTFIHLACTGAEITHGLFGEKPARDQQGKKVPPQLNQLADILCEKGTQYEKQYRLPVARRDGNPRVYNDFFPPNKVCDSRNLKRKIDLVLFSFGGNDIGFAALVGNAIMQRGARDISTTAHWYELLTGNLLTYGIQAPINYLANLDKRFAEAKIALNRHFGVTPDQVIQTAYESFQQNEKEKLCSGTVGMDMHPVFRFRDAELSQTHTFSKAFFHRLKCIAKADGNCPRNLATGAGTGFHFIDEHQPKFVDRGICALSDNERPFGRAPRYAKGSFAPWNPDRYLPYGPTHRHFRSPNDAFMTANMHLTDGVSGYTDRMNLTWAALYSGAFHRNAQGHAVVGDYVMPTARRVLGYPQQ